MKRTISIEWRKSKSFLVSMKRGYNSNRTYQVRCKSGLMGWRTRLQNIYSDLEEWKNFARNYELVNRLGKFDSPEQAWETNPVIEGSTNPDDFRLTN